MSVAGGGKKKHKFLRSLTCDLIPITPQPSQGTKVERQGRIENQGGGEGEEGGELIMFSFFIANFVIKTVSILERKYFLDDFFLHLLKNIS